MSLFSRLFGKSTDFKTLYESGAIILDVRTPQEFRSGHVRNALNVPVGRLKSYIPQLKEEGKPVITCCRSGARSAMAKSMLVSAGLEAYNGGPWNSLEKQLQ